MKEYKNIIIIEDDLVFCKILTKFLEKKGYRAIDAQNAGIAMERISHSEIGLAVIDYRLPDMNGIALMQWIKTNSPNTDCILMSRYEEENLSELAFKEGAVGFLSKPFDPDELINLINGN